LKQMRVFRRARSASLSWRSLIDREYFSETGTENLCPNREPRRTVSMLTSIELG